VEVVILRQKKINLGERYNQMPEEEIQITQVFLLTLNLLLRTVELEVGVVTLTREEEAVDTAEVDDTITPNSPVVMAEEDEWVDVATIIVLQPIIMVLGLNNHLIPINLGMDLISTKKEMIPLVGHKSIINLPLPVGELSSIVPIRRSEAQRHRQKKGKKLLM